MFSVPGGEEFQYEKKWSVLYNLPIVEDVSGGDFLPPFCFKRFPSRLTKVYRWLRALLASDIVLDMTAVSYVGPPLGSHRSLCSRGRFVYFCFAWVCRKPFFAWTQSYGPFSTPLSRFLARLDLKRQAILFCRGDECVAAVKELLPTTPAMSFPDVAVVLGYSQEWGKQYVKSILRGADSKKLITVSPSAVIHSKTMRGEGISRHIEELVSLCRRLAEKDYQVLLLPHSYRPKRHDPMICDYAVSQLMAEQLTDLANVFLLKEDLSPVDLKSIISTAHIHIGARYHSVVAALSSGVPCISLSWHPKYRDIMHMYGMQDFVYDVIRPKVGQDLLVLFEEMESELDVCRQRLKQAQDRIVGSVETNTTMFVDLLKKARP